MHFFPHCLLECPYHRQAQSMSLWIGIEKMEMGGMIKDQILTMCLQLKKLVLLD